MKLELIKQRKIQTKIIIICAVVILGILFGCAGCGKKKINTPNEWITDEIIQSDKANRKLTHTGSMELTYASKFRIDYYEQYTLIRVADGNRYLIIPEGEEVPEALEKDIQVIYQPLSNIYLAGTATMADFDALQCMEKVGYSSIRAEDWSIESAREAMQNGTLVFAGKYSEPDYELLLSEHCTFAIESTMIEHVPEVKEKLEELGILVFTDYSSYEEHPLGRTEWIKVYGTLLGKSDEAERLFEEQVSYLQQIENEKETDKDEEEHQDKKTVAFFYVSSQGSIVARKSGDYVTKMIALAGGTYIFNSLGDSGTAMSTVKIDMEEFYAVAKDADYIIYNSTIDDRVKSLDDFRALHPLFGEFRAVKNGNVWITRQNLYQDTTRFGIAIQEMNHIFAGDDHTSDTFFTKLQ